MTSSLPASARALIPDEEELVEIARRTIDAATDAGLDEGGGTPWVLRFEALTVTCSRA